jgi:hypothetical protein
MKTEMYTYSGCTAPSPSETPGVEVAQGAMLVSVSLGSWGRQKHLQRLAFGTWLAGKSSESESQSAKANNTRIRYSEVPIKIVRGVLASQSQSQDSFCYVDPRRRLHVHPN